MRPCWSTMRGGRNGSRQVALAIVHYKCTMYGYGHRLYSPLTGTGPQEGGLRVSRRGPDRTAPIGQDNAVATTLRAALPLRLSGAAGCSRRRHGGPARVPGTVPAAGHLRRGAMRTRPASLHQGEDRRCPRQDRSVPLDWLAEPVACREGDRVVGGPRRHASPVAAVEAGSGRAAADCARLGAPEPFIVAVVACLRRTMEGLPSRGVSGTCGTARAGFIAVACQLHPDLSRTRRPRAASGRRPDRSIRISSACWQRAARNSST